MDVASRLLGFGQPEDVEVRSVSLDRSPIPFIGADFAGQPGWSVAMRNLPVAFGPGREASNPHITGFEVLLTADGSQLVEIRSLSGDAEEIQPPLPGRSEAEAAMRATPGRYVGLPQSPPKLTVASLLSKAWEQGFADLDEAREIRINYILYSNELEGVSAVPRWIIHLRGTPPRPGKGPGAQASDVDRSHLRLFYDEEGRLLGGDTLLR
jgi:hypothetical protein